jgi:hypothetical protein
VGGGHCRAGQVSWVHGTKWPNDVGRPLAVLCDLYMREATVVRAGGGKEPREGGGQVERKRKGFYSNNPSRLVVCIHGSIP